MSLEKVISSEFSGLTLMLVSRIKYEIKLAWGFNDELNDLEKQLTRLSELLAGVSSEPITNQVMNEWLNKIKDSANAANILLDEWSYDVLNLQMISSNTGTSTSSSCCEIDALIMYPISRFLMGHRVRSLRNTISSIYNDGMKLGIQPIEVAAGEVYSNIARCREIQNEEKRLHYQRECASDELLVGRDDDMNHLVELLCDPSHSDADLTVIGVVGLAGLGKTALSKRVSKAEKVSNHFDSLVIWLVVSHSFDLIDCLNRMVEILFGKNLNMRDRNALILKLQEKLKGKKYLLILDDVWVTTFWESFRSTLHDIGGSKGSMLLVTTRNIEVVATMETANIKAFICQLKELSKKDRWLLFLKVVNDDNLAYENEKTEIARRMVKKCGGVPLAIRALGDLLRVEEDIEEWRKIEESEEWKKEDKHGILPSLRLSYNYLPNIALKKCFAYCGIFKEDEVIEKDRLIYMWMAHGLLQPYDDGMERTGEKYCKVLLNSSLFQEEKMDKYGNVKTFKMHDLVSTLARIVSMGDCWCSNGDYDGSTEVQHLSIMRFNRELTKASCMKLQTLFHEGEVDDFAVRQLKECRRLKVLKMHIFDNEISMSKLLDSRFKHLRYLELDQIWSLGDTRPLPNIKLYHLQTLWIREYFNGPKFIKGLIMTGDLVNLRHIHCPDLGGIGIPEGLSRLTALQTLPIIDLQKEWGGKICDLGLLNNLRNTLELHNVKCIDSEEDASSIFLGGENLKHLERLTLVWDKYVWEIAEENPQQNEVIEAMQPHSNLKQFKMTGYGGTMFPRWLTERGSPLHNLVSLSLKHCPYAEGYLQMENFRYLRFLKVSDCDELSLSFPDSGFQCCKLLEEIKVDIDSSLPDLSPLTRLRVLHFENYDNFSELVGLANLACLRELKTDQLLPEYLDEHSPLCESLRILTLSYSVESIPEWLRNLRALKELKLNFMKKLKCLPSKQAMQCLTNLHTFNVFACPMLEETLRSKGEEWLKIAHIPNIMLDHKRIT